MQLAEELERFISFAFIVVVCKGEKTSVWGRPAHYVRRPATLLAEAAGVMQPDKRNPGSPTPNGVNSTCVYPRRRR